MVKALFFVRRKNKVFLGRPRGDGEFRHFCGSLEREPAFSDAYRCLFGQMLAAGSVNLRVMAHHGLMSRECKSGSERFV